VGFDNSAASAVPQSTILRNLNAICPRAAELERCNRFSNCRTIRAPIGQMDIGVEGHRYTGCAADESPDIGAIRNCFRCFIFSPIFKSERSGGEGVENQGKMSQFLTPCVCTNYSCHT